LFSGEDLAVLNEALTRPAQQAGVNSGSPSELQVITVFNGCTNGCTTAYNTPFGIHDCLHIVAQRM
jgi:hypothetical protein